MKVYDKKLKKSVGELNQNQVDVLKERGLWGVRYIDSSTTRPAEIADVKSDSKK